MPNPSRSDWSCARSQPDEQPGEKLLGSAAAGAVGTAVGQIGKLLGCRKRAHMQGFVAFDHIERWDATAAEFACWIRSGDLVYQEDVAEELGACPDALAGPNRCENKGKCVIRL